MSSDEEGEDLEEGSEEDDGEGGGRRRRKGKKRKRGKKKRPEKRPFDRSVVIKTRKAEGEYVVGSKARRIEHKQEDAAADPDVEQKPKRNRDITVHCYFFSESPLLQWRIHVVPQPEERGGHLLAFPMHMLRIAGGCDDTGLMKQLHTLALEEGHRDFATIVAQLASPKQAFAVDDPAFRAWACDYALKGIITPTREEIPDYAYTVACYVPTREALECSEEEARDFLEAVRKDRYAALYNNTKLWMTPRQFRLRYLEEAPFDFTGGSRFAGGRVWTHELSGGERSEMLKRKAIVGWKQKLDQRGPDTNPAEKIYLPTHIERVVAPLLKSLSRACYGVFEGTDAEMIGRHESQNKALVVSLCSFQSPPGSITITELTKSRDIDADTDIVLIGLEQPSTDRLIEALTRINTLSFNRLYMLVDLNRSRRQVNGLADLMIAPCNFFSFPRIIATRIGGYRDFRWIQPFEALWPAAKLAGPNGVVHLCVTFTLPPEEAQRIYYNSFSDDAMMPGSVNYRDIERCGTTTGTTTDGTKAKCVFLRITAGLTTPRDVYSMLADFYPGTPCVLLHDSFRSLHLRSAAAEPSSSSA